MYLDRRFFIFLVCLWHLILFIFKFSVGLLYYRRFCMDIIWTIYRQKMRHCEPIFVKICIFRTVVHATIISYASLFKALIVAGFVRNWNIVIIIVML